MTETKLIVLRPDGTRTEGALTTLPTLEQIAKGLDGAYLEVVPLFEAFEGEPCVAFCDEDGKRRLPRNLLAQRHWEAAVGRPIVEDYLVGPIVIVTGPRSFLERL